MSLIILQNATGMRLVFYRIRKVRLKKYGALIREYGICITQLKTEEGKEERGMKGKIRKNLAVLFGILSILILGEMRTEAVSEERKITVMIYMCGSDLESENGAATNDIMEMLKARFDSEKIEVLAMTGGSSKWWGGFSTEQTSIYEISGSRPQAVYEQDRKSMGEPDTLSTLLNFGYEMYPAETYGLILWDHGGGPLNGVCWDRLAQNDNLTMSELQKALENSPFAKQPLEWIGFDACLMSSVETAYLVSPYARYMIASQETEPGTGWNYSFLNGLEKDADGAETGKRIVDTYYETTDQQLKGKVNLTLSCLDLSQMTAVEDAMDIFFDELTIDLTEETFSLLSNMRQGSRSFGRAEEENQDCDLVDLADLVTHYAEQSPKSAESLQTAIQKMIVCSRSNVSNSNGLSVYHPYYNKELYRNSAEQIYMEFLFAPSYTQYIRNFAALWLGEPLGDWTKMAQPVDAQPEEDNTAAFSIQLTKEQQKTYAAAELIVLKKSVHGTEWDMSKSAWTEKASYSQVYVTDAVTLDDNGVLTANYSGKGIYAADEEGNPITAAVNYYVYDGKYWIYANYIKDNGETVTKTIFACREVPGSDRLEIQTQYVFDESTNQLTNRLSVDSDEYDSISLPNINRRPSYEGGRLKIFDEWEESGILSSNMIEDPSSGWSFRFFESQQERGTRYAAFQITDTQANTYCSELLEVKNTGLKVVDLTSSQRKEDDISMEAQMEVEEMAIRGGIRIRITATNHTDASITLKSRGEVILNQKLSVISREEDGTDLILNGGKTCEQTIWIGKEALINLDRLESAELFWESDSGKTYSLNMTMDEDISALSRQIDTTSALAKTEAEGVVFELLELKEDTKGNICGILYCQNQTDSMSEYQFDRARFNHFLTELTFPKRIAAPQTEAYIEFESSNAVSNSTVFSNDELDMEHVFGAMLKEPVTELTFDCSYKDQKLSFLLETPFEYKNTGDLTESEEKVLFENEVLRLMLSGAQIKGSRVELRVIAENSSDLDLTVSVYDRQMNGKKAVAEGILMGGLDEETMELPADTTSIQYLALRMEELQDTVGDGLGSIMAQEENALSTILPGENMQDYEETEKTGEDDSEVFESAEFTVEIEDTTGHSNFHRIYFEIPREQRAFYAFSADTEGRSLMKDLSIRYEAKDESNEENTENAVFASDVGLPEHAEQFKRELHLELSDEQVKKLKEAKGMIYLRVDAEEDEIPEPYYLPISFVPMTADGAASLQGEYSGLAVMNEEGEQIYPIALVTQEACFEIDKTVLSCTNISVDMKEEYAPDNNLFSLREPVELNIRIDYDKNKASVEQYKIGYEGENCSDWPVSRFSKLYRTTNYATPIPETDDGTAPSYQIDGRYYLVEVDNQEFELDNQSFRLALVPATELKGELYVRYKLTYNDGTEDWLGMYLY